MIHPFKLNGYNIILDVNSGSIHNVDDVAYDVICLYENTPKEEIEAVIQKKISGSDSGRFAGHI